jgi:hypothetical protein
MHRSPRLTSLFAAFALTACGQAQVGNDDAPADATLSAGNAAQASTAQAGGAEPSGNASWGEPEPDDEASHRGVDFIVFNRTGRTITAVAIRPDEGPLDPGVPENPWSENILVQQELPAGTRSAAHAEPDIELCTWEIRATFDDGQTRDYPTMNLCETIRVDLR